MNQIEWQKLKEAVLYILNKEGKQSHYCISKILYFAQRMHLANYGRRIIADDFKAKKYGPVPSYLYDAVKRDNLSDIIRTEQRDNKKVILFPIRDANTDYLSLSDIECLDASISENVHLTFDELKEKSHDSAWDSTARNEIMSSVSIARAGGASESVIEYIQELEEIEKALI